MAGRLDKYRGQISPERAKVWKERSPKYAQNGRRVSVVYYLSRNHHIEHPHFIQVPLSSPDGLYLRDVIKRLDELRGRGMPAMYSWSSKRSYKTGYVWHDLSDDDMILPTNGNEYTLKGSELFEYSISDCFLPVGPIMNIKMQNLKQLPGPESSRSQDDTSSSSSMNGNEAKHSQEDEQSPSQKSGSRGMSPDTDIRKNVSTVGLLDYKVAESRKAADASTQTEDNVITPKAQETCTRGVSTEDGSLETNSGMLSPNQSFCIKENSEISHNSLSTPTSSSASSSGGKTETLESLIRADTSKINSFRILEEEEFQMVPSARLKATNMLLQLISCGSISVKDHSFGLIPTYRPRFSSSKFPSPLYSSSVMFGEFDCLSENPRLMRFKFEDKEYFSGSLIESKILKDGDKFSDLKHSSSFNADRHRKQLNSAEDEDETTSGSSKCISQSINRQPRSESMRSPTLDGPRISSNDTGSSRITSPSVSNGSSKRITESLPSKQPSTPLRSPKEEKKVIKIEERLASGARVIIQSKASSYTITNHHQS